MMVAVYDGSLNSGMKDEPINFRGRGGILYII
jgi:hypothetical protein